MPKENIQDKITQQIRPNEPSLPTFKVPVQNVFNDLLRVNTQRDKFKEQLIDLSKVLQEKIQFLLFGKSVVIDHDKFQNLKEMLNRLDIHGTFFSAEGDIFNHGGAYIVIDKLKNGFPVIRVADPNFPNVIKRIGTIAYEAEI